MFCLNPEHQNKDHRKAPHQNVVKFNCDAAMKGKAVAVAAIARDSYGNVLGIWNKILQAYSAKERETQQSQWKLV